MLPQRSEPRFLFEMWQSHPKELVGKIKPGFCFYQAVGAGAMGCPRCCSTPLTPGGLSPAPCPWRACVEADIRGKKVISQQWDLIWTQILPKAVSPLGLPGLGFQREPGHWAELVCQAAPMGHPASRFPPASAEIKVLGGLQMLD